MTDHEFTERIRDEYQAPTLSAQQAAQFDAALTERLRPHRWRMPLAGLALAAAALGFWVSRPATIVPAVPTVPVAQSFEAPDDGLLAFLEPEFEEPDMPDDYLVLADALDF